MRALDDASVKPSYYTVGSYDFDPELQIGEEVWIHWQIMDRTFEIPTKVTRRRKEVHVDGKQIVLSMSESEKAAFNAIYPNGLETLQEGASLFLLRIFLEAKDKDVMLKIQEAISRGSRSLPGQKQLPKSSSR